MTRKSDEALFKRIHDDYEPPVTRNARRLIDGFETPSRCQDELDFRVKQLAKGNPQDKNLSSVLEISTNDRPAWTFACPFTARSIRRWLIGEGMKLFDDSTTAQFMTVFFPEGAKPQGSLHEINWDVHRWKLKKQLSSRGIWAFGAFSPHFCEEEGLWKPHWHGLVRNISERRKEELEALYPQKQAQHRPLVRIEGPRKLAWCLGYSFKIVEYRKPFERVGARPARGKRLRPPHHREFMRYLDRLTLSKFLLIVGGTRNKGLEFRWTSKV